MTRKVKMVEFRAIAGEVYDAKWQSLRFKPEHMEFTTIGGAVRYSYSPGQAPAVGSGHPLFSGGVLIFHDHQDIINFRFVPETVDVDIVITHKAG